MALGKGTSGNDTLSGTPFDDYLFGLAGNDTLRGLGGNDVLDGGPGNDLLAGGNGHDELKGRAGNDTLRGGTGNDSLAGGAGNDDLIGDDGNDRLSGGAGRDRMSGGAGNDTLDGGTGDDRLKGGDGDDVLLGAAGDDTLIGGAGADQSKGGDGNDLIVVGSAQVVLADGGEGVDTVNLDALGASIDLTGALGDKFANIEKLDLGGETANTLVLSAQAVLDMAGGGTFPDGTLLVKGDGGDAVNLQGTWTKGDTISDPFGESGKYVSYTSGDAKILVESELGVLTGGAFANLDLATLDGTNGFTLIGGISVSSAGDVNGDGFADVIVGAGGAEGDGGADAEGVSYVVFGKGTWAGTPSLDLATLDGTNGFRLIGIDERDFSGSSVSSAGDVNGDGFADLIVGAPGADGAGEYGYHGESYVVFGKASWLGTPALDLATLDGTNGFRLIGISEFDRSGFSVSSAGDVNGDGFDDLIVGAPRAFGPDEVYGPGTSYVVFGKANWAGVSSLDLATLDGTNGFRLVGIDPFDEAGRSVSSAEDVNGDGFDDLIVGAPIAQSADGADLEGESYVVFGKASWTGTPSLDLATLDGSNGFRLIGIDADDRSGFSVSSAGDVNGDGFADLIVGAPRAESAAGAAAEGESYVIYGKATWAGTPSLDLATLDGTNGFRLIGIDADDNSGSSVSSAGDVNGDGFADLIVGAPGAGAYNEGESYVIFGGNFTGAVTHLGTPGDDTLTGGGAAETFVGGTGNDLLIGNGGADAFQGGAGDDVIAVGSILPFDVNGGTGIDAVNLDALGSSIDLSGLDSSRFVDIEKLDLSGSNANTLTLDAQSVFDITGTNGDAFGDNTLLVKGDAGDTVNLEGIWGTGTTVLNPFGEIGSFVRYTNGQAQVLVESGVTVLTSVSPALDLAALDGINGFTLIGIDAFDSSGFSVSSAGDVNGDGFDDLIVGAPFAEDAGGAYDEGASYVVFGKASWAGTPALDLATLDGTNGFRLIGDDQSDFNGFSVSSAGDVNGDGFADLITGAPGVAGEYDNGPYVVFGKASWAGTPSLDLATLDGTNGFHLVGIDGYDFAGRSVSSAGDVNGDGFDDVFIGAPRVQVDPYGTGGSYVVFGKASWAGTPSLDLATLDGTNGFRLESIPLVHLNGTSVSSAGDVNGDGFDDLIVGAPDVVPGSEPYGPGESYVVFGKAGWAGTPSLDLATLDGANGFRITGIDPFDGAGASVSSAGDVNGDGFADLIVGANTAESAEGSNAEGESYVVFGKASWAGMPSFDLAALDGTNGFRLIGIDANDLSGFSVASAGDVNGDGFDDVIVGAPNAEDIAGESYVVYGKANWAGTPSLDLATLDGTNGFRLIGVDAFDRSGFSVSSAGDVNGDGFSDLIVGAPLAASTGGAYSEGESYVIFGGSFNGAVTHLGTPGDDTLTGGAVSETFVGGTGNDLLIGNGGSDAFQGGAGDDTIVLGSALPFNVNGGSGVDSVNLDARGALITLSGLDSSRFVDIEKFDLTGTNGNTLVLDAQSVFDMAGANGDDFADNTLLVKGDAEDAVRLAGSWTKGATLLNPFGETGSFVSYTSGQAQVLVESDVTALTGPLALFDLATLDGTNGFTLIGIDANDQSGYSVSSAGDVNGDGFADLIIGAPDAEIEADVEGESYVVFGKASWVGVPSLDLATLDGTNGFRLIGSDAFDHSGFSVSSAGDVNGDGFADVIVGARFATSTPGVYSEGESYVVFGKASWAGTPSLDLATLDGSNGFTLIGIDAGDLSGHSVSSAGDVNGDGFADLIVGAPDATFPFDDPGESYVVFGKANWAGTPSLDLATLDGSNGFRLIGIDAGDQSGFSVSSAGDVNGDGFEDLIVGANDGPGESYVVFGKANWAGTPSLDLATLDGINGFRLTGIEESDQSGRSVSSAGDVNGDGFADLIVGAPFASPDAENVTGESYVVFGKASWAGTPSLDLAALDGTNGFRLTGIDVGDFSGHSVSSAGDVNGDGFADLIIGAYGAESTGGGNFEGESYVVYGKASWAGTPSLDLATLDGTNGFRLVGIDTYDGSGRSVSTAGDVNGDGFADLIVGASGVESAGESYVVFGGDFIGAVTHLGSPGDDTLIGSAAAESFVGGTGDDLLIGKGGADAFQGGAGDDVVRVASLDLHVADGGSGADTLALDGGGLHLDLTALADSRTRSIERIDIGGSGDNMLTLSVLDVLNLSDESNELLVLGEAGDVVNRGAGWTTAASGGSNGDGTSTIDGQTYQIYNAGQATLLIDTDITANTS